MFGLSLIDEIRGFCVNPDDPIYALNNMEWAGVGGGGNTHDTCVAAVGSMVARRWSDAEIHDRVARAKREACEHAGQPFNWPEQQKTIQGWIDSARAKDFGAKPEGRQHSQGAYAEQFVDQYRHMFLYDVDAESWFTFDGQRWRSKAFLAVKHHVLMMLPNGLRSSGFVSGIEQLLRGWPELQVHRKDWNPTKHLLNTPTGTVDLRTGVSRPHDPADRITCVTTVSPSKSPHPLWSEKQADWFGADQVEKDYMQTLAGLCLTGETKDAVIPFWIGPGGDGKSVITNLWQHLLGDYARTSTETAFIETRQSQHSEELAWLSDGVRLVIVPEAGGVWAESRLKQVTGGERISAAFKHKSVFEFQPQFNLLITSNEPPRLRSAGKAMARRFQVYPFSRPIANPDPNLPQKLREEGGAILWWMIEGAIRYHATGGLQPSPSVVAASAEYMHENDQVQQWLDDCAIVGEGQKWRGADAFQSYRSWAEEAGIRYPLDRTGLTRRLKAKGIQAKTAPAPGYTNSQRCYIGISSNGGDDPSDRF